MMHRVFVEPAEWGADGVDVPSGEAHHLTGVLRLTSGAEVVAFDGEGREAAGRLIVLGRQCRVRIGPPRMVAPPVPAHVLFQALPKGSLMDLIVEKAVELGASAVVPVQAARSVARVDNAGTADRKRQRWVRIARGAAAQCGSAWVPEIAPVAHLEAALDAQGPFDCLVVAALQAGAPHLVEVMGGRGCLAWRRIGVMIGPEGDWTADEVMAAKERGARCVSLGRRVLRTETAALFCLSILSALRDGGKPAETDNRVDTGAQDVISSAESS